MKQTGYMYVSETKFHNLFHECSVMVSEFLTDFEWKRTDQLNNAQVVIEITEDYFFVRIKSHNEKVFPITLKDFRHEIRIGLYETLSEITDKKMPWGILHGIRPTKLIFQIISERKTEKRPYEKQDIIKVFTQYYRVSEPMAQLAYQVAMEEEQYLPESSQEAAKGFSLYISIPFCPTRCHYCSFPSYALDEWTGRLDSYLNCLLKEFDAVIPKLLKKKTISTLYIGGGTPTSLSAGELNRLLDHITKVIPMEEVKEFTVEAGRPDTITREKLGVMKKYNVGRISINPQTMNQKTLDLIGRRHRVEQVGEVFSIARDIGFKRINMDLIVGLPNEHSEDLIHTLNEVMKLEPSEITIHTLAVKRSSKIHEYSDHYQLPNAKETTELHDLARQGVIGDEKYKPYYLYRQKNMVGSFENIGYYRDKPCIYNMEIMEEVRTIVALGAGGVTKVVDAQGKIKRIDNVKNVNQYMERIDEMIERKKYL